MGIHGLWKLLEPAGKDVTLESLENKILAIDVSLWLHQAQQGVGNGGVGSSTNAHLLTLFHRISKLLFYRIKPVFVFDGIAPELKKKTISARNQRKLQAGDRAKEMRQQLLLSLIKSKTVKGVLQANVPKIAPEPDKAKRGNAQKGPEDDIYNLPPLPSEEHLTSEDSCGSEEDDNLMGYCEIEALEGKKMPGGSKGNVGGGWKKWNRWVDPHEVNVQDEGFRALPVEVRREILTDLKEARKESSWGRLHKMPKNLDSFSSFQMSRLLHRRKVQEVLEDVEKELSTTEMKGASLGELEAILAEKGVDVVSSLGHVNQRIASDENKGFVLLRRLQNQNADNEANEKKTTDFNLLAEIKEEPVDNGMDSVEKKSKPVDQMHLDELATEKAEDSLERKHGRRESFHEPTSSESKLLNAEEKVRDFVKVVIGTSDDEADEYDGGIFDSMAVSWNDGNSEEGLSQREIMQVIKSQKETNSTISKENSMESRNETQLDALSYQRKEVLGGKVEDVEDKTKKVQETENSCTSDRENLSIFQSQPKEQGTDETINTLCGDMPSNPNNSDIAKVHEILKDTDISGKQSSVEIKETNTVEHEKCFDLESEGEFFQRETKLSIDNKSIDVDMRSKEIDTEILYEAEIETSTQSATSTGKDKADSLKNESSTLLEEVVIVEENESGGLTQEEILAIISSQPTKLKDDEISVEHAGANSDESDESDFLEVGEDVDEAVEGKESNNLKLKESCQEDSSKGLEDKVKAAKGKEVEVVIDLDVKSDDSNDIFADIFESDAQEKNLQPEKQCEPSPKDETGVIGFSTCKNSPDETTECSKLKGISEDTAESRSPGIEEEKQPKELPTDEGKEDQTGILTEEEKHRLTLEMRKREREAMAGVTEKARLESQELLGLFGVPWVVAPFEAEAQCAFLECAAPNTSKFASSSSIRKFLAEGTVTEDSDIWAFGALNVYRHVFDRRRMRVRVYSKEEIYNKLGLSRAQVVQLALLTGSDYTIGLPGVGTVTALEILAAFPGEKNPHAGSSSDIEVEDVLSGLQHFAEWWKRIEMNEQSGTPVGHSYFDPSPEVSTKLKRRLCTCWKAACSKQPGASLLPQGFPSRAVVQAYLKPSVDECRDTFTWLKPDEAALRSYAQLHFGWTKDRTESILRPLFRRLKLSDSKDRTQMSLHSYFSHIRPTLLSVDIEGSNFGVRTKKALERIAGKSEVSGLTQSEDLEEGISNEDKETNSERGRSGNTRRKTAVKLTNKPGNVSSLKSRLKVDKKLVKPIMGDRISVSEVNASSVKETGFSSSLYSIDKIPQREKDCSNALQTKLKAIEVLRKSSMGRGKRVGRESSSRQPKKKLKRAEVTLSESSDSD